MIQSFLPTSSYLTPFGDSDFLLLFLEKNRRSRLFLAYKDDPLHRKFDPTYYETDGGHSSPQSNHTIVDNPHHHLPINKIICRKSEKILKFVKQTLSLTSPPEVEPGLAHLFRICIFGGADKLPIIIAKDLKNEEKAALIEVLKSHKRAIAWKLSDIKGINPEFCTHKILIEEDYEPTVQHQRRVNPKIHDVIKKEVEKLLDAGLIYPISDSPWVSPVHCVPKKGGMTASKQ
ncbi:hypothetical protein Tco_1403889 [Tanacetum coccineum]